MRYILLLRCLCFFAERRETTVKVIKNINNNCAVCQDSTGREVVAFGKGIGFKKPPYEIKLSQIERTYYHVNRDYLGMINEIPEEVLRISDQIISYARSQLNHPVSSNIVFTLADHIQFCLRRHQKNMNLSLPILYDVQHLFTAEMKVGEYGLKRIREAFGLSLPKEEAAYIALHLINAQEPENSPGSLPGRQIIETVSRMIEEDFQFRINTDNFHYSRFVSHMHYLLKRGKSQHLIRGDNDAIYQTIKKDYPQVYACSERVSAYLNEVMHTTLTEEEKLYLMLHINRLCEKEDCCQ